MGDHVAIQSAETMAFMRAVVSGEKNLAMRSEDRLAWHFLSSKYRLLISISLQSTLRRILEFVVPGSYGFTIARTRHFDEVLLSECRAGVEQLVLLGAGYDSRPFRFREALRNVKVFEIDHPGTQERKRRMLSRMGESVPTNLSFLAVDFTQQTLQEALAGHGFSRDRKTLFVWEGVSYYLPQKVVEGVLDFISGCAAGSSVVFDYATKAYVNGDTSTFGGAQCAYWLRRVREPFVFGLEPKETREFLSGHELNAVSDLGPEDLADAYLKAADGGQIGGLFGHIRMVHARVIGLKRSEGPAVKEIDDENRDVTAQGNSVCGMNDRLRQTFTGGRVVLSPGILSLPPEASAEVLDRVRDFTTFDPENEEHHDFGRLDVAGITYCFELECRSRARDCSQDPGDSGKTTRVMTIMRADEY